MTRQILKLVFLYCTILGVILFLLPNIGWGALPAIIIGFASWFPAEYVANRFIVHGSNFPKRLRRALATTHALHHRYPMRSKRLPLPFALTFSVSVVMSFLYIWTNGLHYFFWYYLGLAIGYFFFEFCHYAAHHYDIPLQYFERNKERHKRHHTSAPDAYYGVTNGMFDTAFGTMK